MANELSAADQQELQTFLEQENAKARLQSAVHNYTDICWDKCITGKVGNKLAAGEEQCLANCVERFLDTSIFIVKRLEETRQQI